MDAISTEELLTPKPLSMAVKDELLRRFERFCFAMAHRAMKRGISRSYGNLDDWLQEARILLIDAGERFDPERGFKFTTYAYYRVWGMLRHKIISNCGIIHIPVKKISGRVGSELIEKLTPFRIWEQSRGDPIDVPAPYEREESIDISHHLNGLLTIERAVIDARFGLRNGQPQTLAEVGEKMSLSKERIRQIQDQALAKMRGRIEKTL